jgi:hypothetical protein
MSWACWADVHWRLNPLDFTQACPTSQRCRIEFPLSPPAHPILHPHEALHSRMPRLRPPLTSTVWRVQHAQVLLLAVKPDMVPNVLRQISRQVTRHHLVISIAAGVTIATLQHVSTPCHTYSRPLAVGTVHPWSSRTRGEESLSRCSGTSYGCCCCCRPLFRSNRFLIARASLLLCLCVAEPAGRYACGARDAQYAVPGGAVGRRLCHGRGLHRRGQGQSGATASPPMCS